MTIVPEWLRAICIPPVQVYLFVARPGPLLVFPAIVSVLVLLFARWNSVRPRPRALRRLLLEHGCGMFLAVAAVHLASAVTRGIGPRALGRLWVDGYIPLLAATSILWFVTHLLLFRLGEPASTEAPLRWGHVVTNGIVAGSVCTGALYLSAHRPQLAIASLAALALASTWLLYTQLPISRILRLAGEHQKGVAASRTLWGLALSAALLSCLAAHLSLRIQPLSGLEQDAAQRIYLRGMLFAVLLGSSVLSAAGIAIVGMIGIAGTALKALASLLTGVVLGIMGFTALVAQFAADASILAIPLRGAAWGICLPLAYLIAGQLYEHRWMPLTLQEGRRVAEAAQARATNRPSSLRGETSGPVDTAWEKAFRLGDFVAWAIRYGKRPDAVFSADRDAVRQCARHYLSDVDEEEFDRLFRTVVQEILRPGWIYENGDKYFLTDFASRVLAPPEDRQAAESVLSKCLSGER